MRRDHRVAALPLFLLLAAASCSSVPDSVRELEELAAWMEGSFSSARQAQVLPSDFYDRRLETRRIWSERTDGIWLYVEQAAANTLDKPYRQRIYRLEHRGFGRATSSVYTLPGRALDYAGSWRDPQSFTTMTPKDLSLREGCAIHLKKQALAWVGGTRGRGCASSLRGAAYATSIVRLFADRLESWDRGFDVSGEQMWGSTQGAYVFEKTSKSEK